MSVRLPLSDLRQLLAARYPSTFRKDGPRFATGISQIDEPLEGGLPTGALSEFVAPRPSCGTQLLVETLLRIARRERLRASLVDSGNSFDPDSAAPDTLPHLLWIRCTNLETSLQAADIIVRDTNIGLSLIDLRGVDPNTLRRTPTALWYRLQRAAENTSAAIVFFTRAACIPSTRCRFILEHRFHLNSLDLEREHLVGALSITLQRNLQHAVQMENSIHVRRSSSSRLLPASPPEADAEHIPPARIA